MSWFLVFIGGGLGAIARYSISRIISTYFSSAFPLATFISNVAACLILGFALWYSHGKTLSWVQSLVIVGFCGGFSTFSTFSQESLNLLNNAQYFYFIMNLLVSILFGIGILFFWQKMS